MATVAEFWGYLGGIELPAAHAQTNEIVQIHGLDPDASLTVAATQRSAGAIVQVVSEAAGTVTVERQ